MKTAATIAAIAAFALAGSSLGALAGSDADLIKNAEMAAPAAVAKAAQIVTFEADGKMKTLREGTNGFWCVPDDPTTPSNDPMCGDANALEWQLAWFAKKDPPKGKFGFGYMLMGGSAASNTDAFAMAPPAGSKWLKDGPHIMIFNAGDMLSKYPGSATPDPSQPYVMFPGTPYAHLMVPVKN
jgi:hypothetical protein